MAIRDCINLIRNAFGRPDKPPPTDDEIQALMQRLDEHAAANPGMSVEDAAEDLAKQEALAAARTKLNALLNLQKRADRWVRLLNKVDDAAKAGQDVHGISLSVASEMHSINTPVRGGQMSAQGDMTTISERMFLGRIDQELEKAKLVSIFKRGDLEQQWVDELSELNKGAQGKPGISGSPQAQKIAEILHRYQSLSKQMLNKEGAWIGDYFGYISRTAHDKDKIWKAGFDQWVRDLTVPGFNLTRTLEGIEKPQEFFRSVWNDLVTGVHLREDFQGFKDPAFKGPGNLAKRLSQSKSLHWDQTQEGNAAWRAYQKKYGDPNIGDAMINALARNARSIALMRRWGTNPRAEFMADFDRLEAHYKDSNPAAVRALREAKQDLIYRFDYLDGTANMAAHETFANVMRMARNLEITAKLSNVAFAHISSWASKSRTLQINGVNAFEGYADFLTSFARGQTGEMFMPESVQEVLHDLVANVHGQQNRLTGWFSLDDSAPGTVSKLAGLFMKYTGLGKFMGLEKAGTEATLAGHFGRLIDKTFNELDPRSALALTKAGLSPAEWELLRRSPGVIADPTLGWKWLTPKAAIDLPDNVVADYLRGQRDVPGPLENLPPRFSLAPDASPTLVARMVEDYKQDLMLRWHGYFSEQADRSTVTPGIVERALWAGGTKPGTLRGEFWRSASQFKLWPTALIRQQLGAEIYGGVNTTATQMVSGIAQLVIGMTLLGYMRDTLRNLTSGKNPPDPRDLRTWAQSAMSGGGLGIFGDYLFGDYSRFGHSFASTLAGPVVGGYLGDVINLWNAMKQGMLSPTSKQRDQGWKQAEIQAYQIFESHIPFVHLFYFRAAWDYLVNWQLMELLNPGHMKRYEQNQKRQWGQTFWLSPTKAVQ